MLRHLPKPRPPPQAPLALAAGEGHTARHLALPKEKIMRVKDVKKVVLAYSGGLDTSVILKWLQTTYKCEVITFTADLGQGEELGPARDKALLLGIKAGPPPQAPLALTARGGHIAPLSCTSQGKDHARQRCEEGRARLFRRPGYQRHPEMAANHL